MPLFLDDGQIKVIAFQDSAIDREKVDRDQYMIYLKNLDENSLTFKEGQQPTRFVMRLVLDLKAHHRIKNNQIKVGTTDFRSMQTGKADVQLNVMTSALDHMKAAIIDIEHPKDTVPGKLAFRKDNDGYIHDDILALLETHGIVNDLYFAWNNRVSPEKPEPKKS